MAFRGLADFINQLEKEGELLRITAQVSPHLQISEIADRVSKSGGKALLFTNNGSKFPLLINAFGSEKRMSMALGHLTLDEIGEEINQLIHTLTTPKATLLEKLSLLPSLASIGRYMPTHHKGKGACQEVVVLQPDFTALPVLTCWPFDGGPFITLPVVHTQHPTTGQRNVGMYRMQVVGKSSTGMHWHLHKGSASHFRAYQELNQRMPVSVVLGGDPVYTYVATAPLPENVDEYMLAGFLRHKKVQLVKCITNDIEVPSDADFVIEGYVDPNEEPILEGPFGDHTGYYSLADYYPTFHVSCITHRKDAVYPTTIVGIPPQEDKWLGKATERIFLPLMKTTLVPELIDMDMPDEGVFHNIVIASIRKSYAGQAAKTFSALWGAGQMMFNKIMVAVDEEVNPHDARAVMDAILHNTHPVNDIVFARGPMDVLDHASRNFAFGGKMGIDATKKLPQEVQEASPTPWEPVISPTWDGLNCNTALTSSGIPVLIVGVEKAGGHNIHTYHASLCERYDFSQLHYLIYIDIEALDLPISDIVWLSANNIDPIRDVFHRTDASGLPCQPLVWDGTRKTAKEDQFARQWPNIIAMDDNTIGEVDALWPHLGIGPLIPSPSVKYKKLIKGQGAIAH